MQNYLCEKGIGQKTIAAKAGIPPETFNEILSGTRAMCADELRAICYALKIMPEVFVDHGVDDA
jgi:predicted transcriptional regulator